MKRTDSNSMLGMLRAALLLGGLVLTPGLSLAAQDDTRTTMREVFAAMQPLLLHALDDGAFAAPGEAAEIGAALTLLERSSAYLASHAQGHGPAFAHLGALLAADAGEAHRRWDAGDPEATRFLVLQMTETCIACHARLPAGRDAELSEAFVGETIVADLPLDQRALVQFATRQFATALETYEALLASKAYSARDIDMMGHLDEYLELAVRVRGEPERAAKALEKFARRPDAPRVLQGEIASWVTVLRDRPLPANPTVDHAQRLVDDARQATPSSGDRDALVEYLLAGSILHRRLDEGIEDTLERARALYLLGVIDTRIGRSFSLSQAETFLEAAIRTAPATPLAGDAFELLEEYLIAGYTGSGGEQIPPDIAELLEALRVLTPAVAGPQV